MTQIGEDGTISRGASSGSKVSDLAALRRSLETYGDVLGGEVDLAVADRQRTFSESIGSNGAEEVSRRIKEMV